MKQTILFSIGFIVMCGWLATGIAWAAPGGGGALRQCEEELLLCLETAQAFPATGQTTCWDTGGYVIPCDGTGQDGDIRAGAALDYTVTDLTIIDNNTKLEWMKQDDNNLLDPSACDSLPGSLDVDCFFSWDEAFAFVVSLNTAEFAGHTDWRVPNVKELQSIVNYEKEAPAVSDEFNNGCVAGCTVETCSCTASGLVSGSDYWSSTALAGNPRAAWLVLFSNGVVTADDKESNFERRVRAVRGGL